MSVAASSREEERALVLGHEPREQDGALGEPGAGGRSAGGAARAGAPVEEAAEPEVVASVAEVWTAWGRLPFRAPSPDAPKGARMMLAPVMRTSLGETAPVGDDAIARAVAALSFSGDMTRSGEVPIPRLKVTEYASFCVEMSVWSDHKDWVLHRYGVLHDAARKALDARWEMVLAEDAGARAEYERTREAYLRHLRAGGW